KTDEPIQSSYVSFDFTSKLINLENPSPADNEIAFLMDTTTHHVTSVLEITSSFTTTIPPPPLFFNPLLQQATPTPTPTTSEATTLFTSLLDFSYILPQAVSDFATHVIEKNVTKSLEAAVLARSSSQLKSTYEADTSLSEIELTKILLDKIEESKSHLRADYKKKLYDALLNIKDLTQEILVGPAFELLKGTCNSLTELEYHLEECFKATTERLDWHNPVIEAPKRVEDLQLGVKSYQKKLNLTKPDTFRLMRADELYKFSDGMLDDVRSALNDIAKGIRIQYMPKRKWSGLHKQRARVMVQDINKQLYERRLMRNLEKFVGER
nr:hypothetical protein [Tanacetum cinerariifolium]